MSKAGTINGDGDGRVLIAKGGHISLESRTTGCKEEFEIRGVKGKGGSCIVYEAFNCTKKRVVLLKEFYPRKYRKVLKREGNSLALKLDSEEKDRFETDKNNFLENCDELMGFFNENVAEGGDEFI